jgi:hypothetical protein
MSHQHRVSAGIAVLTPVTSVALAAEAARAGARAVDAGADPALVLAIQQAGIDVLICGPGETADISRDMAVALRSGTGLLCADAAPAVRQGIPRDRILVQVGAREVAEATQAGWRTLVDVDTAADVASVAGAEAVASVCAWLGAAMVRTRYPLEVRRCLDMTESIAGRRPPAWAVRGLA